MSALCRSVAALVPFLISACAIVPDIPPDFALPVQDILAQTACELQEAFLYLDQSPEFQRFKAKQWLVTISLQPKVDTDVTVSGGWTRKSPFIGNPTRFVTWAISGPGLQLDAKGDRTGGINFNFISSALMADKTLQCPATPSIHALAQHLGVAAWLRRTAGALAVASSAKIDKPLYNTEITIKMSGNGSYTFTFPPGTDLAALSGSYTLDEQLNISMAPIADKTTLKVVTLPVGENFRGVVTSSVQLQSAQNRLDLLGIEQAIRSLQIRPSN